MRNTAQSIETRGAATQEAGSVARVDGDTFVVRTAEGERRARRAVSCLVEPEAGDLVLVAAVEGAGAWVLAVLEREAGAATRIVSDGDMELRVDRGRFSVVSREGVDLATAGDMNLAATTLDLHADEARVATGALSYLGATVKAEVERVKVFAVHCDQMFERLSQRVRRSYRTVSELDQLRAEQIDYAAKENLSLRGENTLVTAKELVKVDGEQIHLG